MSTHNGSEKMQGSIMVNTPMFPAMGNHEYDANRQTLADEYFSLPHNERWYAFTYSNIRFVVLDTTFADEYDEEEDDQRVWLDEEVGRDEYTDADWQIVLFHNPPYSSSAASEPVQD